MSSYLEDKKMAETIAFRTAAEGGTVYYVGGFVRDRLRMIPNKDIDIEVHGIKAPVLEGILDSLGKRITIGESFGIYGLKGYSLDIAMPRKEEATGRGHKDFAILVDPWIGTRKAALRRDFTINALMEDVLTGEVIDCFGGLEDLARGLIRHVNSETFVEDPLRVLRAAQFAARFGFFVAKETIELCQGMDLSHLPSERILGELEKALCKADRPSVFFEELRKMKQLSVWFPELEALIGVPQNRHYHQEGDVWTHTMMVLDEAAGLRDQTADPLCYMLSALTHDMGKALVTEVSGGEIHAFGHDKEGVAEAKRFICRLTNETHVIRYVLNMTENHMRPNMLAQNRSAVKKSNRMFDESVDPEGLLYLARADELGKIPRPENDIGSVWLWERLKTYRDYMARPFVRGRDLIEAGLLPGPQFSSYLAYAHKLRLAGVDRQAALKQTLALARKDKAQEPDAADKG